MLGGCVLKNQCKIDHTTLALLIRDQNDKNPSQVQGNGSRDSDLTMRCRKSWTCSKKQRGLMTGP